MGQRKFPRILMSEPDFADAAEDMGLGRIGFGIFSEAELRSLCDQKILTDAADRYRRTAARMAYLGRLCFGPRIQEGTGTCVDAQKGPAR